VAAFTTSASHHIRLLAFGVFELGAWVSEFDWDHSLQSPFSTVLKHEYLATRFGQDRQRSTFVFAYPFELLCDWMEEAGAPSSFT
jgi:hypothetical protein